MIRLIWLLLLGSAFGQLYPYAPPAPASSGSGFTSPVQTCAFRQAAAATTLPIAANCSSSVTSGHFLFIVANADNTMGTVTACDETGSTCPGSSLNTYTCHNAGGFAICYANITTGGALTVIMTAGTAILVGGETQEWAHQPSAYDTTGAQSTFSAGTTWTFSSLTLATTNELMVAWGGNQGTCAGSSSGIFTGAGGFSIATGTYPVGGQYGQTGSDCGFLETQVVSASGATTASATLSTSNSGFGATAAFKP